MCYMFRPQDRQYYRYLCYRPKPTLKFSIVTGGGSSVSIATSIGMGTFFSERLLNYFYRCTVHLEDSLSITPTNALVYHVLISN